MSIYSLLSDFWNSQISMLATKISRALTHADLIPLCSDWCRLFVLFCCSFVFLSLWFSLEGFQTSPCASSLSEHFVCSPLTASNWPELNRAEINRTKSNQIGKTKLKLPNPAHSSHESGRSPSISHVVPFTQSGELFSSEQRFSWDKETWLRAETLTIKWTLYIYLKTLSQVRSHRQTHLHILKNTV